jgi:ATP-dependent protease ClpP protease subunit
MFEIRIDGVIGKGENEIPAQAVRAMLPEDSTTPIVVKLHTEGGDVFEGFAIYDMFREYPGPKKAVVESMAFSIGSFIPMAFDEIEITPNGYMMVHEPWWSIQGSEDDLKKGAELLANVKAKMIEAYSARTGKTPEEIAAICKQETYLNAESAVQAGFADRITAQPVAIQRPIAKQSKMPHGVVVALVGATAGGNSSLINGEPKMSETTRVAASLKQIKAAFPKAKADFVIRCMEKDMTVEEVGAAAMEELNAENETLSAKVKAMEDELAALKAEMAEPKQEEEEVVAVAPKAAVAPVAKARSAAPAISARNRWNEVIAKYEQNGLSRPQAAAKAVREHRDLHAELLQEANS